MSVQMASAVRPGYTEAIGVIPATAREELLSATTIAKVARLISKLPEANTKNANRRRKRQSLGYKRTVADAWRQTLVCGFTSQEDSSKGSLVHRFAVDTSKEYPLRELSLVQSAAHRLRGNRQNFERWILDEVTGTCEFTRLTNKKTRLVAGLYPHYSALNSGQMLADLDAEVELLHQFRDLSLRGSHLRRLDQLEISRTLSEKLEKHSYGIGPKQLRNVLCNLGLATNVVPLDSRWNNFLFQAGVHLKGLQRRGYYLDAEDMLRRALVLAHRKYGRTDIENLSVLDAIVFERGEKGL